MRLRIIVTLFSFLLLSLAAAVATNAHCQIPCGIYDDEARFVLLNEHITTIEKSMKLVTELSAEGDKNYNQIVRWVVNKEDHADQFIDIVTQYFLAQRIKPTAPEDTQAYNTYLKKVELLHHMIVYAMKCKQTTDPANTEKLTELVAQFKEMYFAK